MDPKSSIMKEYTFRSDFWGGVWKSNYHVETESHVPSPPRGVLSKIRLLHSRSLGNSNSSIEYGPKTDYFVILFIKNFWELLQYRLKVPKSTVIYFLGVHFKSNLHDLLGQFFWGLNLNRSNFFRPPNFSQKGTNTLSIFKWYLLLASICDHRPD